MSSGLMSVNESEGLERVLAVARRWAKWCHGPPGLSPQQLTPPLKAHFPIQTFLKLGLSVILNLAVGL